MFLKTDLKLKGNIVIGTVKGDLHDIGKNIVGIMLEGAEFQVIDLGYDVSPEKFIEALQREGAQILAMTCLLTTTMIAMKNVMEPLRKANLYRKTKVMISSPPPITDGYARKIGTDAMGNDA